MQKNSLALMSWGGTQVLRERRREVGGGGDHAAPVGSVSGQPAALWYDGSGAHLQRAPCRQVKNIHCSRTMGQYWPALRVFVRSLALSGGETQATVRAHRVAFAQDRPQCSADHRVAKYRWLQLDDPGVDVECIHLTKSFQLLRALMHAVVQRVTRWTERQGEKAGGEELRHVLVGQ